jgi:hypothetical protein
MGNSDQVTELYQRVARIEEKVDKTSSNVDKLLVFTLGNEWHEGEKHQNEDTRKTLYLLSDRVRTIERRADDCNLTDIDIRVTKLEQAQRNAKIRTTTIAATMATMATSIWQWEKIVNFFTGR